jgi:hypothetical protein
VPDGHCCVFATAIAFASSEAIKFSKLNSVAGSRYPDKKSEAGTYRPRVTGVITNVFSRKRLHAQ